MASVVQNNVRFYSLRIEAFDPQSGQKVDEWGPNANRPGIQPNQEGIRDSRQGNVLHHQKELLYKLLP